MKRIKVAIHRETIEYESISGYMVPDVDDEFAVIKEADRSWGLVHRLTGLCIHTGIKIRKGAIVLAQRIHPVMNWGFFSSAEARDLAGFKEVQGIIDVFHANGDTVPDAWK